MSKRLRVLAFPYDQNPYQELLYSSVPTPECTVRYVHKWPYLGALTFPVVLVYRRICGFRVLHIHWPAFVIVLQVPYRRRLSLWFGLFCLWWAGRLGYRTVWTVHNVVPHQQETADDVRLARSLSQVSDAKIVHSSATLEQMRTLGLDTRRVVTIPHGNYVARYQPGLDRQELRAELGVDESITVLLFFGLIRPYKGVLGLIDAFSKTAGDHLRLVIAGKCADPTVADRLARQDLDPRIIYREGYVADSDVQAYFQAADIVCLPFTSVTTSGSALLAASFAKPLVASRLGDLADIPSDAGVFYEAEDPNGLRTALAEIVAWPLKRRRVAEQASGEFAASRSWEAIAASTLALYRRLVRGDPVGGSRPSSNEGETARQ